MELILKISPLIWFFLFLGSSQTLGQRIVDPTFPSNEREGRILTEESLCFLTMSGESGSGLMSPTCQLCDNDISGFLQSQAKTRAAPVCLRTRQNQRASLVELRTTLGTIIGTVEHSDRLSASPQDPGRRFYAFRGVPYAKPPVGPLRWTDPQPSNEPWEANPFDATRYKPFCPQYDHDKNAVVGSEDCLYLNIFLPLLPGIDVSSSRLPVLVFIHGGAYTRGASSSHGPERLMREDIIVVTLNYRLGVLGLLSTEDSEFPGNYAALDQVMALRWVRRYIADFGGDYDLVTLGGFSAGAGYVHLHTMSPLSQGLFHKAILMSGAGNCLWSVQNEPWLVARGFAIDLDCPTSSTYAMRQCLQLKDATELLKVQARRSEYVYWPFEFRPVVDQGIRERPFLPAPVSELLSRPLKSSVPVLIGGTPEEGILFALTVLLFSNESSNPKSVFEAASLYTFQSLWPNTTSAEDIAQNLKSFYYSKNAKTDLNTLVAEMTDAMTDLLFTSCIWDAAAYFASLQVPVHTYLMTHHDENTPSFAAPLYRLARAGGVTSPLLRYGVSHGDDVVLIFNFPYTLGEMSPRDLQMSLVLTSVFGSFIKTGNPHSNLMSQFPPWEPIKPGEPVYYYRLSLNPGMIQKPFRYKERNLWRQLVPKMERTYDISVAGWNWQIGFWFVLSLVLLFILIGVVIAFAIYRSRHSREYPGSGATLKSRRARPTSLPTE